MMSIGKYISHITIVVAICVTHAQFIKPESVQVDSFCLFCLGETETFI